MKGVILHGGVGTRLRPLTHTGPKQLIPVANKPISQYVLEDLLESDIREIALVLGNTSPEKVKEYYGDGSRFNAKITFQLPKHDLPLWLLNSMRRHISVDRHHILVFVIPSAKNYPAYNLTKISK
jgi:NDP-sugar pyrophosphorylase family protein